MSPSKFAESLTRARPGHGGRPVRERSLPLPLPLLIVLLVVPLRGCRRAPADPGVGPTGRSPDRPHRTSTHRAPPGGKGVPSVSSARAGPGCGASRRRWSRQRRWVAWRPGGPAVGGCCLHSSTRWRGGMATHAFTGEALGVCADFAATHRLFSHMLGGGAGPILYGAKTHVIETRFYRAVGHQSSPGKLEKGKCTLLLCQLWDRWPTLRRTGLSDGDDGGGWARRGSVLAGYSVQCLRPRGPGEWTGRPGSRRCTPAGPRPGDRGPGTHTRPHTPSGDHRDGREGRPGTR